MYQYFLFIANDYYMVWMYHILFTHSSVNAYLDCLQFQGIMNNGDMNISI